MTAINTCAYWSQPRSWPCLCLSSAQVEQSLKSAGKQLAEARLITWDAVQRWVTEGVMRNMTFHVSLVELMVEGDYGRRSKTNLVRFLFFYSSLMWVWGRFSASLPEKKEELEIQRKRCENNSFGDIWKVCCDITLKLWNQDLLLDRSTSWNYKVEYCWTVSSRGRKTWDSVWTSWLACSLSERTNMENQSHAWKK